jgi:hypothetical protein
LPKWFPAGLEMEKRHEEELMELKLQLKQALAEEQQVVLYTHWCAKESSYISCTKRLQVAEEVDRIKRLLTAERAEKERRDKDLEVTAYVIYMVPPQLSASICFERMAVRV